MRVLVCGGRTFGVDDGVRMWIDDQAVIQRHVREQALFTIILDQIHKRIPIAQIIHGAAKGADSLANDWAFQKGVEVRLFPAEWDRYGRRAGPVRNAQMLREGQPDLVVAFPESRGTRHMVQIAREAGVGVAVVGEWVGARP